MSRRIAVVTTSRAEYGLLRFIIDRLSRARGIDVSLIVSGTHLHPRYGLTVREIEADGHRPAARIPLPLTGSTGRSTATAMAAALDGFARAFERLRPDIVLVLGDRFEVLAAGCAAVLSGSALAHLNGGEVTGGVLDEGWRHALTKISHLHFPATREFARRIRSMGEDAFRIHVVGSPGLEAIRRERPAPVRDLEDALARPIARPFAVCTVHPVTARAGETEAMWAAISRSLSDAELGTIVFTAPNADSGGRRLLGHVARFGRHDPRVVFVPSLGSRLYLAALRHADVVIGNSSSGLIEAPSFGLPVVNVGSRQEGRPRARNVIDVEPTAKAVGRAIARALSPAFRRSVRHARNPYGDGRTSERVVRVLRDIPLDDRLRAKKFADLRT